ncbi:tripartite motif-containing protein 43B-like isoform X1 [Arvicanthis niloticus]|uniref:tripartite motif-containing protein 43B-like isoform X1 n=1 Tax=Arvicanthis niloticus TaxID=61156 RepID=UPI00402B1778
MESDILQASQKILKCFICLGIFTDPVLLRCGHTFCRACLFLISENIQIPAYCPMCRQPSQWEFRTDITMKKLVSIVKKERFMKYLSSEEHKCVTHKERKMIFCDENRVLLCQLCSDSQEHRGHRHCPTEVAIGEQMEKILKQMESLRKKIQEQQENLEAERRMATKWVGYVTVREQMIRMAYRKLHPALDEEENQHIKCMKNEGNTILEELRKSEAMMAHKKSQLIEAYQELMTMSQKPYEVLLLQDLDDMFRRSELVQLGMPQRMKPKLSAHPNTGLTARFNFFQVLPRNTIPTPSSRVEEGSPKSSIKVEPKKDQHATHVLRQSHHRNIAAPLHADEHQVRACTSRDNPQAEATALTKHTDNATSDEDQKKRPLRKVKVPIKKNRHVLPECADNTLDKGKAHLKVAKVESKRCKCLSSILKKFSRKKTVAPLVVKRPQVLPGAFTETAQITTEVLPENADAAPSAGGQGEPPVGMAKVRWLFLSLL